MFDDLLFNLDEENKVFAVEEKDNEDNCWDTGNIWSTGQIPTYVWVVD